MFKRRSTSGKVDTQNAPRTGSLTTTQVRAQAAGAEPTQRMVKVAVVPPRLPPGMAAPTGIGASDCFSWDESINWSQNESIAADASTKKSWNEKIGLTTKREKHFKDVPNFTFREVPYNVWRKHYAKDKDGNYHGTHAPAEDCLLNDADVAKWRLEEPKTKADLHTRGKAVLPVYEEAKLESDVPEYTETAEESNDAARMSSLNRPNLDKQRTSSFTADGKTAEEIVREATEKGKIKKPKKEQWRDMLRQGVNMQMGS